MAGSFRSLPRAAQRAAFAHMGDEHHHLTGSRAKPTQRSLGSGARHRLLASKAAASPVEVLGGTPKQRMVVGQLMKEVAKDFPPELTDKAKVRLMNGPAADFNYFSNEIRISARSADDHLAGKYEKHARNLEEVGLHTKSGIKGDLPRLLTHEFGHFLDSQMPGAKREKLHNEVGVALEFSPRRGGESNSDWFRRNKDKIDLGAGSYAATNPDELAAELWTEYAGRRNNARPAARVYGQAVLKELGK